MEAKGLSIGAAFFTLLVGFLLWAFTGVGTASEWYRHHHGGGGSRPQRIKGGMTYGASDEFGFAAVEKKVHVHDLHATILHLMGIDHEKLTYRYSGRDFRLTDVHGTIVKDILA